MIINYKAAETNVSCQKGFSSFFKFIGIFFGKLIFLENL